MSKPPERAVQEAVDDHPDLRQRGFKVVSVEVHGRSFKARVSSCCCSGRVYGTMSRRLSVARIDSYGLHVRQDARRQVEKELAEVSYGQA